MSDRPGRLLVVLAHPDDESLACGGTIARCVDAGIEVTLVCVTHGHAGTVNPDLSIERADLPAVREAEFAAATSVLGVEDAILLDHRDALLPWLPAGPLIADLQRVFDERQPDAVISFGEDGLYWHPDHIFLAEQVREVVTRRAAECPAALYGVTMPRGAMERLAALVAAAGHPVESSYWGVVPGAFGVRAEPPSIVVDVRPVIDRKVAAILCHRSQLPPSNPLAHLDARLAAETLGIEHFHLLPQSQLRASFLDELAERS
jgi:LmbE family N-acetylglucosaminyl deacetylase